ncbi:phospholipase A2 [Lipomyces arxii]|uniref:phospholipase A2 n=1 Tax=Lipomyces arxii TaxID=56418 RepID=UPI0034CEA9A6
MDEIANAISDLIELQHDLTPVFVPVHAFPPTALEFLRQVHSNQPAVYKAAARDWPALDPTSRQTWSKQYLADKLRDTTVNVSETPFGNADSVVDGMFVKPHECEMPFTKFLDALVSENGSVCYMQSQNNNMASEFPDLVVDVEMEVGFASEAFGVEPEAVNLWIGSSKSTTSLHKDPYENLHVQILGKKVFKLISPFEHIAVRETNVQNATYVKTDTGFTIRPDKGTIPWPIADPDRLDSTEKWHKQCRVLELTLEPGDMLYLPALWYHKVSQQSDQDGICCSLNFWYDMDFTGPLWSAAGFVRQCANVVLSSK